MYLKTIKAYGFKSFADKIEINFEKNINGIVGPNGSGKSNVVDAVRWVLGEQSMKSLRGETATDIIFSGSKSRKPLNSASVTLIFDNTDLYLPIQYTEVSVKRVIYRSGENEYYLNNEKCRLKDITNLLTDTGADKESFNIISQGKIDEILSTKPADRRGVFESAAGVMKYKKRKEEAVKKLERTNLNLNRVNDIINELENNLPPLERQSKDATKYLEVKDVLSNLNISLIASDITKLTHEEKIIAEKIDTLKDEVVKLSTTHSTYDIELLEKKDEQKKLEEKLREEQNTLIELTKSIEKINADIRLFKMKEQYSAIDKSKEEENLIQKKEQLLIEKNTLNEQNNSIFTEQAKLAEEVTHLKEVSQKLQEELASKNKLTSMLEKSHQEINNLEYKINYLRDSLEKNNSLPHSVKSILNNKRLTGVHNIVGSLITMDNSYTTAITTALSASINYLVVSTTHDAKQMVTYLKENNLGRATFLPIDTIKPRTIDSQTLEKLKNTPGFIDIASNLVEYQERYQNIITNLLGNIIICNNIDTATNISKSIFNRYKIITLDGQVINVGGSITGGSIQNKNNIIKEKYDLENNLLEQESKKEKRKELENLLTIQNKKIAALNQEVLEKTTNTKASEELINEKKKKLIEQQECIASLELEIKNSTAIQENSSNQELERMLNMYYSAIASHDNIEKEINLLTSKKKNIEEHINEIEALSKQDNANISQKEKVLKELEIKRNTMDIKLDNLLISLGEEYNLTYESAINNYKLEIPENIAREKVRDLKNEIKSLGYVNVEAIEEYKQLKERYEFLNSQRQDLKNAESTLLEIMKEMDDIMKEKFLKTFESIRLEFKKVFHQMFRGGSAELRLTDPDNLLETGIEIEAIPSGKNLKNITLLSGGEKTFTAISLLFAILNVRPVPFCLLDEVEAALDDANVESFGRYLDEYRNKTQFILITHKKKTMEFANTLYGITMQESGVSKLVSVKLEDIEKESRK